MSTSLARGAIALALLLIFPTPGSAHVKVYAEPDWTRTPACSSTEFIVFVPNERPDATVRVELRIPPSVRVIAIQPLAGWTANLTKTRGRITGIIWSGGSIHPLEYQKFSFLATPQAPQTVSWDALQTYENGEVVKWTGNLGSDTPHSQIGVTPPLKSTACRPGRVQ